MSYVTYVLQKLFGYHKAKATALMLDVHHKGRAAVSSGDKEKVEGDVSNLHAAGLWATMQRSERARVNGWKTAGRGATAAAGRDVRRPGGVGAARAARRDRADARRPRRRGARPTSSRCSPASAPARPPARRSACSRACCPTSPRRTPSLAAGLRSLHEPELIEAKDAAAADGARHLPAGGGRVELAPAQAEAWLAALNDVRLALGTALEVTEDMPDELTADDPRSRPPGRLPLADVRAGLVGEARMRV